MTRKFVKRSIFFAFCRLNFQNRSRNDRDMAVWSLLSTPQLARTVRLLGTGSRSRSFIPVPLRALRTPNMLLHFQPSNTGNSKRDSNPGRSFAMCEIVIYRRGYYEFRWIIVDMGAWQWRAYGEGKSKMRGCIWHSWHVWYSDRRKKFVESKKLFKIHARLRGTFNTTNSERPVSSVGRASDF